MSTMDRLVTLASIMVALFAQSLPPPPPPPQPPAFMKFKKIPLHCFDKEFDQSGDMLLYFCNEIQGLAGVAKKGDETIWVSSPLVADTFNYADRKRTCQRSKGEFSVSEHSGLYAFNCNGVEMKGRLRFQYPGKKQWQAYKQEYE